MAGSIELDLDEGDDEIIMVTVPDPGDPEFFVEVPYDDPIAVRYRAVVGGA
jgi:hypothetical protein